LKNYGYKWWLGGTERSRSWCIDVGEKTLDSELEYLSKEIYERDIGLPIALVTPFNRFSEMIGIS